MFGVSDFGFTVHQGNLLSGAFKIGLKVQGSYNLIAVDNIKR